MASPFGAFLGARTNDGILLYLFSILLIKIESSFDPVDQERMKTWGGGETIAVQVQLPAVPAIAPANLRSVFIV